MQGYVARLLHVVEKISLTVRQTTVCIRIPDAPVKCIASEGVLSCELTVISGARAVVIFGTVLHVALCVFSLAPCVAAVGELIKDVFQLILMVTVLRKQREVEHGAQAHVAVILVVHRVAQIVGAVVCCVVDAKQVVLHVSIRALLRGVVERRQHAQPSSTDVPSLRQACSKLKVAYRCAAFHAPVVVQRVVTQVVDVVAHLVARRIEQRGQLSVHAAVQAAQAVVESKKIGGRAFGIAEIFENGRCVPVATERKGKIVRSRYFLRVDNDEATRIVGRIFGRWRLDDGQIVNLRAWNDVEGEGS